MQESLPPHNKKLKHREGKPKHQSQDHKQAHGPAKVGNSKQQKKDSGKTIEENKSRSKPTFNRRNRRKPKPLSYTSLNDNVEPQQQQREIDQIVHVLGSDRIKLYKRSKTVKSYGFIVSSILDQQSTTFIINVPQCYPREPIKISATSLDRSRHSNGKAMMGLEQSQMLLRVINNFNFKAREFCTNGEPLLMQLNYLLTQWSSLGSPKFKQNDQLHKCFLEQFKL